MSDDAKAKTIELTAAEVVDLMATLHGAVHYTAEHDCVEHEAECAVIHHGAHRMLDVLRERVADTFTAGTLREGAADALVIARLDRLIAGKPLN